MAALNKIQLIGNVGREPETRIAADGSKIINLPLAVSERWKDKATGEARESTEWFRVVFFGKLADVVAQYVGKGSQLYIEGKLRTRKYTDRNGAEKQSTEVVVDQMQMVGSRQAASAPAHAPKPVPAEKTPEFDDDIPW